MASVTRGESESCGKQVIAVQVVSDRFSYPVSRRVRYVHLERGERLIRCYPAVHLYAYTTPRYTHQVLSWWTRNKHAAAPRRETLLGIFIRGGRCMYNRMHGPIISNSYATIRNGRYACVTLADGFQRACMLVRVHDAGREGKERRSSRKRAWSPRVDGPGVVRSERSRVHPHLSIYTTGNMVSRRAMHPRTRLLA